MKIRTLSSLYPLIKILCVAIGIFLSRKAYQEYQEAKPPTMVVIELNESLTTNDISTATGNISRLIAIKKILNTLNTHITSGDTLGLAVCNEKCTIILPPTFDRDTFHTYSENITTAMMRFIKKDALPIQNIIHLYPTLILTDQAKDNYDNNTIIVNSISWDQIEKKIPISIVPQIQNYQRYNYIIPLIMLVVIF